MMRYSCAVILVLALAATAEAGPFRRRAASSPCGPGGCSVGADTSSAQGVAEAMARSRSTRHFGGNAGREGVGIGMTRDQAIRNCCYHPENGRRDPKIEIRDVGAARGGDGRWYACIRE